MRYLRTDSASPFKRPQSSAAVTGTGVVLQCLCASFGSLFQGVSACRKADGQILAVITAPSLITLCNWISFEMSE